MMPRPFSAALLRPPRCTRRAATSRYEPLRHDSATRTQLRREEAHANWMEMVIEEAL